MLVKEAPVAMLFIKHNQVSKRRNIPADFFQKTAITLYNDFHIDINFQPRRTYQDQRILN